MTCIVGIAHKGIVYIGGDSAGVDSSNGLVVRTDRKVFRNGHFVMGFTTSYRMGQILAFNFNPPAPRQGVDVMAYMATDFIDAAREEMKRGGYAQIENGVEHGGTFLVGFAGRLFNIASDFQVAESTHGFDSCGSGEQVALGSLHSTKAWPDPRKRIREALEAAETFNAVVRRPFHIEAVK